MIQAKNNVIKEARIRGGYSLRAFAENAKIHYSTAFKAEQKNSTVSAKTAKSIVDALGISFDDVFVITDIKAGEDNVTC